MLIYLLNSFLIQVLFTTSADLFGSILTRISLCEKAFVKRGSDKDIESSCEHSCTCGHMFDSLEKFDTFIKLIYFVQRVKVYLFCLKRDFNVVTDIELILKLT